MYTNDKILVGKNEDKELSILLNMANRHGLITGASGTGKTITLKVMAESFSDAGVPVFLADVKGDLAGTAIEGDFNENIQKRVAKLGLEQYGYECKKFPVRFWDLYGENGHPIRTTISSVGSDILSMMLGLSEAQEGNLAIVFEVAKDEGLELINLADLRSTLQYVAENKDKYITKYGNITTQSIGVIQRSLLALEKQGADKFFGEPALDIHDFFSVDNDGHGIINILHAVELFQSPDLYASFLLWLLNTLFASSPEVGDLDKPKMVFFFDEAHLLFNGMPSYRLKRIVQVVKLIRSRGIGLYFVSQNPTDVPDEILAQLGNRVQHALRAYTPSEQKIIKAAADAFRTNPKFNTQDAISELGTGEALISFQNEKGAPEIVERATILPPQSYMGAINDMVRMKIINNSDLCGKYDEAIDNESAHEKISKHNEEKATAKAEEEKKIQEEKAAAAKAKEEEKQRKEEAKAAREAERQAAAEARAKTAEERQKLAIQKQQEALAAKKKANSLGGKIEKTVTTGVQRGVTNAISSGISKGIKSTLKNIFK
jgi:DNA helicase HerA-like ATPase